MPTRFLSTSQDLDAWVTFLRNQRLPLKVSSTKGSIRSHEQNRLQRKWCTEVSEQLDGWSPEYVRGYGKLHFGVPILRYEDDEFAEKYDAVVKPLPYEAKIAIMMEPLDLPVTRRMTTEQNTRYLDAMRLHWIGQGVSLTMPERVAA